MPTGSPVAVGDRLDEVEQLVDVVERACGAGGLTQSRPTGTPRIAAISGVTFARRQQAAEARLRALGELDLDRAHRRAARRVSRSRSRPKRPALVAAAEVAGADLEDQVAAVAVVRREAALAGVLQAAGERARRG